MPPTRPEMPPDALGAPPDDVALLYEDDALLVVHKPAGLLSVPGRGDDRQDCVLRRVKVTHADALIVHRLDQATSGLLVLARDAASHRQLSIDFAARRVHKRYIAIVAGTPAQASGSIDLPLACDWPNRPRQQVDHVHGKPSLTHWRLIGGPTLHDGARLQLEPVTGRSHQLRVHLAALGHAIVGDTLYAPPPWDTRSPRLLLHAEWLQLPHPRDGRLIEFSDPASF